MRWYSTNRMITAVWRGGGGVGGSGGDVLRILPASMIRKGVC